MVSNEIICTCFLNICKGCAGFCAIIHKSAQADFIIISFIPNAHAFELCPSKVSSSIPDDACTSDQDREAKS